MPPASKRQWYHETRVMKPYIDKDGVEQWHADVPSNELLALQKAEFDETSEVEQIFFASSSRDAHAARSSS